MKIVKFILAVLGMILGLVGCGLCIAGVVAIWKVKDPLTGWMEAAFQKVDRTLGVAVRGLGQLNRSLEKARANLASIKDNVPGTGKNDQNDLLNKALARMAARQLGPQIGSARDTVEVVTEAAVVLNSMLGDLQTSPQAGKSLDTARLREISDGLGKTAKTAEELSRLLEDDRASEEKMDAVRGKTPIIGEALERINALLEKCLTEIGSMRDDVARLAPRVGPWIDLGAIFLTLVLVWIALGQLSLLVLGWECLNTTMRGTTAVKP